MENIISFNTAGILMIALLLVFSVFHLLVMSGIIPFNIIWGGRVSSRKQMLRMESVSLLLMFFCLMIVSSAINLISVSLPDSLIKPGLWIIFVLFVLNTLGNLAAKTSFEKYAFGPITLIIALLALRMVLSL